MLRKSNFLRNLYTAAASLVSILNSIRLAFTV